MRFFRILCIISFHTGSFIRPGISSYQPGEKVEYTYSLWCDHRQVLHLLNLKPIHSTGKRSGIQFFWQEQPEWLMQFSRLLDIYESYIDPETELPVKSIRNIQEGRYRKYNEVIFDHYTRTDSAILTSDLTGIHITPKGIHDILSCFYYFRNHIFPIMQNLKKGEMITIMTWFTDELYPIRLKYIGIG